MRDVWCFRFLSDSKKSILPKKRSTKHASLKLLINLSWPLNLSMLVCKQTPGKNTHHLAFSGASCGAVLDLQGRFGQAHLHLFGKFTFHRENPRKTQWVNLWRVFLVFFSGWLFFIFFKSKTKNATILCGVLSQFTFVGKNSFDFFSHPGVPCRSVTTGASTFSPAPWDPLVEYHPFDWPKSLIRSYQKDGTKDVRTNGPATGLKCRGVCFCWHRFEISDTCYTQNDERLWSWKVEENYGQSWCTDLKQSNRQKKTKQSTAKQKTHTHSHTMPRNIFF